MDNKKLDVLTVKPDISFFENETLNRLLTFEREVSLDAKVEAVESFMVKNPGHGLLETDKDLIYGQAQGLLNDLKKELRDTKFSFYLNRTQYNFLTDLLLRKLEYDVNTIFIAIELTQLLGGMSGTKYSNDSQLIAFEANATEITYIYHLIAKHTVKGLTKDTYTFSKLLIRIGDLSKIINYYDASAKRLVDEISQWALRMDASDVVKGEVVESNPNQFEAEVAPKKAKKAKSDVS